MTDYLLPAIGILGTLAVTLGGIIVRRIYGSIDLLFGKIDRMQREINHLKLAALKSDPDSSIVFRSFMSGNGDNHK